MSDNHQCTRGAAAPYPDRSASRVFISYSRTNFYMAEALRFAFNRNARVEPWMDLYELAPGSPWTHAIEEALDASDALVLVASRYAFDSPQVNYEWNRALDKRIPVVLAIVSRCRIPPPLQSCARYDVRTQVQDAASDIAFRLTHGIPLRRSQPSVEWSGTRTFVPPVELLCLFSALTAQIALLAYGIYCLFSFDVVTYPIVELQTSFIGSYILKLSKTVALCLAALGLAAILLQLRVMLSVFYHRLDGLHALWSQFAALADICLISAYFTVIAVAANPSERGLYALWLTILLASTMLAGAVGALIASSTVLLRYTTPGGDFFEVRRRRLASRRIDAGLATRSAGADAKLELSERVATEEVSDDQALSFEVLHEEADAFSATFIAEICLGIGMQQQAGGYWRIIIVSDASDLPAVEGWAKEPGKHPVLVLVSRVDIPVDAAATRRYQWLDFRSYDFDYLQSFFRSHTHRGITPKLAPVPINPESFRAPPLGEALVSILAGYGSVSGAASMPYLLSTTHPWHTPASAIALLSGVTSVALLLRLFRRSCSGAAFRWHGLLTVCLFCATYGYPIILLRLSMPLRIATIGALFVSAVFLLYVIYVVSLAMLPLVPRRKVTWKRIGFPTDLFVLMLFTFSCAAPVSLATIVGESRRLPSGHSFEVTVLREAGL